MIDKPKVYNLQRPQYVIYGNIAKIHKLYYQNTCFSIMN